MATYVFNTPIPSSVPKAVFCGGKATVTTTEAYIVGVGGTMSTATSLTTAAMAMTTGSSHSSAVFIGGASNTDDNGGTSPTQEVYTYNTTGTSAVSTMGAAQRCRSAGARNGNGVLFSGGLSTSSTALNTTYRINDMQIVTVFPDLDNACSSHTEAMARFTTVVAGGFWNNTQLPNVVYYLTYATKVTATPLTIARSFASSATTGGSAIIVGGMTTSSPVAATTAIDFRLNVGTGIVASHLNAASYNLAVGTVKDKVLCLTPNVAGSSVYSYIISPDGTSTYISNSVTIAYASYVYRAAIGNLGAHAVSLGGCSSPTNTLGTYNVSKFIYSSNGLRLVSNNTGGLALVYISTATAGTGDYNF